MDDESRGCEIRAVRYALLEAVVDLLFCRYVVDLEPGRGDGSDRVF